MTTTPSTHVYHANGGELALRPPAQDVSPDEPVEARRYADAFRRSWPLILLIVVPLTVNGLIGLLNTTRTWALSPTFTEPFGGDTDTIAGATVSVPAPVVKNRTFWVNGNASPFVPCRPPLICTK